MLQNGANREQFLRSISTMSPRARRQTQTAATTHTPPAKSMVTPSLSSAPVPRLDRIAQRAYSIYERRGGQDGGSVEDWLQAEREIDSEE